MVHLRKARRRIPPPAPPVSFGCESFALVGDKAWVRVTGELDIFTAPVLAESLRVAVNTTLPVVVDLGPLEFMDSAGVHVLVDAASRARREHQPLRVVHASAAVDKVFTLTRTDRIVGVDHA
jgi:anti-sigma B factor antagonist